ncbi:MAG: single-stranded-DNA-specific exonuclease RecJ [Eubacteriales bacterium]
MRPKRRMWNIINKQNEFDSNNFSDIPKPIAKILLNRGINNKEKMRRFLNPEIKHLHNPFLMKEMKQAVNRILIAIDKKEYITIYGDYDVDGITSTSILYLFLKELGAKVDYYIPDRIEEGYGINNKALEAIKSQGTDLVITVDTGIAACKESIYAKNIGLDLIITDHHECQDEMPQAIAVIDPKREDCTYPFNMLAGVGVTFKLIHGISLVHNKVNIEVIWKYLDIVAIGTVADIVPLIDENRVITKLAFETIPTTWNVGLKALLKKSDYKEGNKITSGLIGFRVAPRLNAGGRMGDAKRGVKLFVTENEIEAFKIADELNDENRNRQELEDKIIKEAIEIIEKSNYQDDKVIVVASSKWHHGVIGIVSSRITERYYRPSILLSIEDGVATGSARSVDGFSIFDALNQTKEIMNKFGGHDMAAGLSIDEDKIELLRERLNQYAKTHMTKQTLIPKLQADMELSIKDIDIELIKNIEQLEPYGVGNPTPQFVLKGLINQIKCIGKKQNHLRLTIQENDNYLDGIGFNMYQYAPFYKVRDDIEVLCALSINEWNGLKKPQMLIKDFRYKKNVLKQLEKYFNIYIKIKEEGYNKINTEQGNLLCFHRKDFEQIYRKLNYFDKINQNSIAIFSLLSDSEEIIYIEVIKVLVILDVFKELNILRYNMDIPYLVFELLKDKKVNLNDSRIYNYIIQV